MPLFAASVSAHSVTRALPKLPTMPYRETGHQTTQKAGLGLISQTLLVPIFLHAFAALMFCDLCFSSLFQ
jgi:hypothetical protein